MIQLATRYLPLRSRWAAGYLICLAAFVLGALTNCQPAKAQTAEFPQTIFLPLISHGGTPSPPQPTGSTIRIEQLSESDSTIEALGQPVVLGIERTGEAVAVEVFFELGGAEGSDLASINLAELMITDGDGTVLIDSITIPADRTMVTVTIQALSDEAVEVPEGGIFQLRPSSDYQIDSAASALPFYARDDRPVLTDDSKLLVAVMAAQDGADTDASGIATVRLSNDNQSGTVNVSFSGLSSPQIAAHIHEASTDNIVYSIPIGQVTDLEWPIRAADPLFTNQAMLDALLAGQLYVNIHSRNYPDGEIKATLAPANGSIEMPTPPSPDPLEVLTGTELTRDIARFLTQATFGPTPETIAELEALVAAKNGDRIAAYDEWLDSQMQIESPSLQEYHAASRLMYRETDPLGETKTGYIRKGLVDGWFASAVYGKAQLRDRVGFALSEIFVISINDQGLKNGTTGVTAYYDMLRRNAFGTYEALLTDVSTHPAMGWYLSHFQNQAEQIDEFGEVLTSPDENYAREIMQLFSIGLVELHPDGSLKLGSNGLPVRTYDQTDITELARVFTGWGMSVRNPDNGATDVVEENTIFNFSRHPNLNLYHPYWATSMKMFEDNGRAPDHRRYVLYHDNGEKNVLGTTIPAGLSGEEDLAAVMDLLSNHPNTAPFISYRLIQRLVTSNPSAGYLFRVSAAFTDSNGDLGAVIKAILLDPEALNTSFQDWIGYGKHKEPVVHFAAMLRLIRAKSAMADSYPLGKLFTYGLPAAEANHYEDDVNLLFLDSDFLNGSNVGFEQTPLRSPTVFNYFLPDYAPPGLLSGAGLVAPELQIATENQVVAYYNAFYSLLLTDGFKGGKPQALMDTVSTTYDSPPWLVDAYMEEMDANSDGQLTAADATFDDPVAVRNAAAALVDALDIQLCAGWLKAHSNGDSANDPYTILVDGLVQTMDHMDHQTAELATEAREERIREALFLVGTAPDCLIQR